MYLRKSLPIVLALIVLLVALIFVSFFDATSAARLDYVADDTPDSSLMFIENVGQFEDGARYQVRGAGSTLWLAQDALWITQLEEGTEPSAVPTHGVNLRLTFPGANPAPRMEAFNPLPTTISYFVGNNSEHWHADVPVWGGVRYVDLYPGIDLELGSEAVQFSPRLVVRSPEALEQVRLKVEGAEGVALRDGAIQVSSIVGDVAFPLLKLVSPNGSALPTPTTPILNGDEILMPFIAHSLQEERALGLGGGLVFSTYLGAQAHDEVWGMDIDGNGDSYVTGYTNSTAFPTTPGTFDPTANGASDIFVSKFSSDGSTLLYSTYLGGGDEDEGWSIKLDGANNTYLAGFTSSTDFPTTAGAFDTTYNGAQDAFVTKLNASGTALVYSTFLGGTALDEGRRLLLDSVGKVYVSGWTASVTYPITEGVVDPTFNGGRDGFITVLNETGSTLHFSTFIGGRDWDWVTDITVDAVGDVYVIGYTESSNFPSTFCAYDTAINGQTDFFATKLNAEGSKILYSTYLGGGEMEGWGTVLVDEGGNASIMGLTYSSDFPTTPSAYDTTFNGYSDVFIATLNPTGTELDYSTFLGASGVEYPAEMIIDAEGNYYIVGATNSHDFPVTSGGYDLTFNGNYDVFVAKLDLNRNHLLYGSFLGKYLEDLPRASTLDPTGTTILIAGGTNSVDFPTTPGAYDMTHNGVWDGFLINFETTDTPPPPMPTPTPAVTPTLVPDAPEINLLCDTIGASHITFPQITTETLTIENQGALTLTWAITEEASISIPVVEDMKAQTPLAPPNNHMGQSGPSCDTPGDIPWLTLGTASGTTEGGNATPVTLTFDSTSLSNGTYTGRLCVASNDPDEPIVPVLVMLNVGPDSLPTSVDLNHFGISVPTLNRVNGTVAALLLAVSLGLLRVKRNG